MNLSNNDRYEFVYTNYSLSKSFDLDDNFFNYLEVISSGNQKKHTTNIYESIQINDF